MLNTFVPRSWRKIYLSRAQTRAMMDPVGDPHGGPAFGERNAPVAAAFAAIAAGTATAAAVATVVGAVALGATAVGAITGSKGLLQIGKTLGIIGAVVGIGAAVGVFGEAAASGVMSTAAEGAASAGAEAAVTAGAGEIASGATTFPLQNTVQAGNGLLDATTSNAVSQGGIGSITPADGLLSRAGEGVVSGAATAPQQTLSTVADTAANIVPAPAAPIPAQVVNPGAVPVPTATAVQTPTVVTPQPTGWLNKMVNSDRFAQGMLTMGGNVMQGYAQGASIEEQLNWKKAQDDQARMRASAAGRLYRNGLLGA